MNRISCSGSVLKLIAIITMLIDHIGLFLLQSTASGRALTIDVSGTAIPLYYPMRLIGRMAFPIFCFLLVEGYVHTRNKVKYARNLLLFALISEIPWNLVHTGTLLYGKQNVFFTLFLGLIGMWVIDHFRGNNAKILRYTIALGILSVLLRSDYSIWGYTFIILLYMLHHSKHLTTAIGWLVAASRSLSGSISFIFIYLYNGRRGFIQGNIGKYFFYIFYPLHLLILYFIRRMYF